MSRFKLMWLRWRGRRLYYGYYNWPGWDSLDCGASMAEHILPELQRKREKLEGIIAMIRELEEHERDAMGKP